MSRECEFLKECGAFYVLTMNNDFPAGRPFGAIMEMDHDLYISTADTKEVYKQLKQHEKMQIIALKPGTREWIRVSGIAEECTDLGIKQKMLEECPVLCKHYSSADAPHYCVFRVKIVNSEFNETKSKIIRLTDRPEIMEQAAHWFHEKWGIPLEAYVESMEECLTKKSPVPQWYMAMDKERIIGGLGVIENDFHNRKDLAPNVCAVYTEEDMRGKGIAGALLHYVCADMKEKGVNTLYLITDHTSFYERYGWEFFCMVQGDGEPDMTRMYIHRG